MLSIRTTSLATLLLLSMIHSSSAFLSIFPAVMRSTTAPAQGSGDIDNDPTNVWYAGLANTIQKVLTNSPLNEAKKTLVRSFAGDYDAAAVRAQLNGLIAEHDVLMLSFQTCPFCIKAKSVLDAKQAKYHVVELDLDPNGKAIRAELGDLIGRTSVPAIFINGNFIGGCNDGGPSGGGVVQLDKSGELDVMLRGVGAI